MMLNLTKDMQTELKKGVLSADVLGLAQTAPETTLSFLSNWVLKRGQKAKSMTISEVRAIVFYIRLALTPSFLTQSFQSYSTSNTTECF